jgi:P4 family phage/plasmid primase-like protien
MLGDENVSHLSLDKLGGQFALQSLLGKSANLCGDLCEIDAVAEGVLKRLTGGDRLTVDRKFKTPVPMEPSVKLIFATNALPRFSDKSQGVWRRLMTVPFRVAIPDGEQDQTLATKLCSELPGIVNWALAGLARLLKQGHFTRCTVCEATARKHRWDCDPVAQFLDESNLYPPPDAEPRYIKRNEIYTRYKNWCENANLKPLGQTKFTAEINKRKGLEYKRESTGDRQYYWLGMGNKLAIPSDPD